MGSDTTHAGPAAKSSSENSDATQAGAPEAAAAPEAATASANAPVPPPAVNQPAIDHVYAWQDVALNRDAQCARCETLLSRGDRGLMEQKTEEVLRYLS